MRRFPAVLFVMAAALLPLVNAPASGAVIDRTIPLDGATALRLNVSGTIHLIPVYGAHAIAFHVVDSGPSVPPMNVQIAHAGRRLDVSITGPSQNVLPFGGASGYALELRYPADLPVDLRENFGEVHVDRVVAPMQIYDAEGNITVDDARSSLTALDESGNIAVSSARSRLMLTTINGNVDATLAARFTGTLVRIESQSGNLHLAVPAGFAGHYDLTAASGRVSNALRGNTKGTLIFMLAETGNVSVTSL